MCAVKSQLRYLGQVGEIGGIDANLPRGSEQAVQRHFVFPFVGREIALWCDRMAKPLRQVPLLGRRIIMMLVTTLVTTLVTVRAAASRTSSADRATSSPPQCYGGDGQLHPCGPAAQRCGPGWPASARPVYHLKDLSCGESDPNGPFHDPTHGMYHLFYQVSLSETNTAVPNGGGPIWGHCASRDLIRWTHLPVPLWNDHWCVFVLKTTISCYTRRFHAEMTS